MLFIPWWTGAEESGAANLWLRPARAGWWCSGCWPHDVLFSDIPVGGDDGARAIGADADVGFAWSGRRRWCRSVRQFRCPHARARGARRLQRALTPTDLHRPAARRCGCWPTSTFLFCEIVVRRFSGQPDGGRAIDDDDAAAAGCLELRNGRRASRLRANYVLDREPQARRHTRLGP
jgi:hypothetical protein